MTRSANRLIVSANRRMTEPKTSQYKKLGNGTENKSPLPAQHPKYVQKRTPFSEEQVSYLKSMLKECVSEATKEV